MRLWSLHPKYLDVRGLTACWREGLLARKVLLGQTRGYTQHPQLRRFRAFAEPVAMIDCYLTEVYNESRRRKYSFDATKIELRACDEIIPVTDGQLSYELAHLKVKLSVRDQIRFAEIRELEMPEHHPLFRVVRGEIEEWEIIK